ncbi:hypothetical protein [Apilactobacillus ozensis]|uniref:hypothetical protein n=1 Tax=Apilactobacillus ozensis TaxID=866801 RepID=UPI00200B3D3A|nr:hypothetical protein [Apilactobacillus ozensis]MCK8607313.1 hypothetical protein [Apilactobacillus ozensis]
MYVYSYCIECKYTVVPKEILTNVKHSFNVINSDFNSPYKFVLSDFYVRDNKMFLDIAYVTNDATSEYLQDLNKLKKGS